jgi:hypothetical protein
MGGSGWEYYVPYQPDLQAALDELRRRVLDSGDYWWAVPYEFGRPAREYPDRPRTEDELWAAEAVQESGTHSILDVSEVVTDDGMPDHGAVQPVTETEAMEQVGVARLTRAHVGALQSLAAERWSGRCAVLHDAAGEPSEIYFWGSSGD